MTYGNALICARREDTLQHISDFLELLCLASEGPEVHQALVIAMHEAIQMAQVLISDDCYNKTGRFIEYLSWLNIASQNWNMHPGAIIALKMVVEAAQSLR